MGLTAFLILNLPPYPRQITGITVNYPELSGTIACFNLGSGARCPTGRSALCLSWIVKEPHPAAMHTTAAKTYKAPRPSTPPGSPIPVIIRYCPLLSVTVRLPLVGTSRCDVRSGAIRVPTPSRTPRASCLNINFEFGGNTLVVCILHCVPPLRVLARRRPFLSHTHDPMSNTRRKPSAPCYLYSHL